MICDNYFIYLFKLKNRHGQLTFTDKNRASNSAENFLIEKTIPSGKSVYPLRRNFRKFYKPLSFTAVLRQLFKPLPRALQVSIFNPQDVKLNIHFMKAP